MSKGSFKLFTLSTFLVVVILGIFGVATPIVLTSLAKTQKMKKINKIASLVGIVSMVAFLCLLTLTETKIDMNSIQIHFSASSSWFSKHFTSTISHLDSSDAIINSLMLAPLGVMTSQYFVAKDQKHSILKGALVGLLMSSFIEGMQCILPIQRTPDFADILFNTLGAFAGSTAMTAYSKLEDIATKKAIQKSIQSNINELQKQLMIGNEMLKSYSKDLAKKDILTKGIDFSNEDLSKASTQENVKNNNLNNVLTNDIKDDAHCKV